MYERLHSQWKIHSQYEFFHTLYVGSYLLKVPVWLGLGRSVNKSKLDFFFFLTYVSYCKRNILCSFPIMCTNMTWEIHFGSHKSLTFILLLQHQQAYVSQFFSQVFWRHQCLSFLSVEQYPSKGFSACNMNTKECILIFYLCYIFLLFPPHLRTQWGHGDFNYRVQGAVNVAWDHTVLFSAHRLQLPRL